MTTSGKVQNLRHIFKEHPQGYPELGKTSVYTSETLDLDNVSLNGGILAKVVVLSIDPYLRGLMNPGNPIQGYRIDEPLFSYGIARVLKSEASNFQGGDHIYSASLNQEEYTIIPASKLESLRVVKKSSDKLAWSAWVGPAGMPGLTAYGGWKEFARAKKGETVFVSTGAGAVGSIVSQLAKLDGLKVIASTGSDEKVKFLKEIGVDVAFNYKTTDTREVLQKEGPVDIYWDNVGGDITDAALENMNLHGRVLVCGLISGYNSPFNPIKNYHQTLYKRLTIQGVFVPDFEHKYRQEFEEYIVPKLASGEVKYAEDRKIGLDKAAEGLLDVLQGRNVGKSTIVVDESDW